jgi:RNA polymerase sigma factor (sigma-70 family)
MQPMDDSALLRQYAESNSDEAFAALVTQHINLVYSVALRHVGDSHNAEEITQAVFIILAKKAAGLRDVKALSSWLFQVTRLTANNFVRSESRRHCREQEAHMQSILNEPESDVWLKIAPLLDDAVACLREKDRQAVVLRFYEGRNLREVGTILGASEDAAEKRVGRALEKLRKFFTKRGVSSTTAIIAGTISANSVQAAPVALAKSVTVVAISKGAAASGSTLTLIKGALKIMAWTKMKTIVGVGILIVAGTSAVIVKNNFFPSEPSYQGRKLSEWLVDVDYGQPPQTRAKAAEAIRKMGTKTLPFLLACFSDDKSGDKSIRQATWGFDALGPIAKPVISKLESRMEKYPGYVPSALGGIGRDALPELLTALTNNSFWVRDNTAAALASAIYEQKITPSEAEAAFPITINNLTYTSTNELFRENTRLRAAGLLGALGLHPDVAVPALIQGMDNTNPSVVAECAASLGKFGPDAAPAVPKMIQGLHNSKLQISVACVMSLGEVGEAFARLGENASSAIAALNDAASSTNAIISAIAKSELENIGTERRHQFSGH